MKRVISVVLILMITVSLAACAAGQRSAEEKIVQYIEKNGQLLAGTFEELFAAATDMTCQSTVKAVGTGIVIDIKINELDDLTQEQKALLQETYDAMNTGFDDSLTSVQKELPEVTYMTVNVCEKDGDVAATINIGKK